MDQIKKPLKSAKPWIIALAVLSVIAVGAIVLYFWPLKVSDAYTYSLDPSEKLEMAVGEEQTIKPVFTPLSEQKAKKAAANLEKLKITWASSNPDVASVDEEGKVTALKDGETTISASFEKVTMTLDVTVYFPLTGLSFDEKEIDGEVGDVLQIPYTIQPENAVPKDDFLYTSSDEEIAEVDEKGNVTLLAPGEAAITLKCGKFTTSCKITVTAPLKRISFEKSEIEISSVDPFQLEIIYEPDNTTDSKDAIWTSSDEKIATVDEFGVVTPLMAGEVDIKATVGNFAANCHVTIHIPMTGISINAKSLTIRHGDRVQLPLSYEPYNTDDDKTTEWTSNNPAVATVTADGTVSAVGAGTAAITATCGEFKATCHITVVIPITGVQISQTTLLLPKGSSHTLGASVTPANTTDDRTIFWSSDNIEVAKVENGVVTAVGAGTAHITANHGDFNAVCTVSVTSPMTGIAFEQSEINLIDTFTAPLSLTYFPADTTDSKVATFRSDNPEIAQVNSQGIVTATGEGTCNIIATVGNHTAKVPITVTPFIAVESISLDKTSLAFASFGEKQQLKASVTPDNASSNAVTWTSADSAIATVSSEGVVTAVGSGTTQIIASAGGKSASCTVSVAAPNKIVVLDPGHGGAFTGASYAGLREEILNLKVAQYCKAYLEQNYAGVTVYLTRSSNVQLAPNLKADLEARAQYAQDLGADILVSLHFNASNHHGASGTLAFVSNQPNVSAATHALGNQIVSRIAAATGLANQGCRVTSSDSYFDEFGNPLDYYAINRHCANRGIPGIIVEHCFMDNVNDQKFCDEAGLQTFGVADAQGIAAYLGLAAK